MSISFGDYGLAYDLLAPCCMGFPYSCRKGKGEVEIVQVWKQSLCPPAEK
jgi:hypothetical protein